VLQAALTTETVWVPEPYRPLPMTKRYLALDIETARLPDDSGDWRGQRPLGITCVALLGSDQESSQRWAEGRCAEVLKYVAQDVRTAIGIAIESERRGAFACVASRGSRSSMPLSAGWLNVQVASRIPLPKILG
jgi:hypothetical protein